MATPDYMKFFDEYLNNPNRLLTSRLKFKKNISPINIERIFKDLLKIEELNSNSKFNGLTFDNPKYDKLLNALSFSFEFNQTKFTRYKYNHIIDNMYINKRTSILYIHKYKIIDFLTSKEVNLVRELIVKMQNKRLFENFNENKASNIIAFNFQGINKNKGNSTYRNRQFFNKIHHSGIQNNSFYYLKQLKQIEPYLLNKYIPLSIKGQ